MENNFDKHIKDSLESLGENYTPGSWELLHQKMMSDPSMDNNQTEHNSFDQNIREKLDQVEANFNPNHWDDMASRLDHLGGQANVEELEFDGLLFEHLNDLRIPFSQAHWTLMSNRLDEEFSIRRKLYKYKVAEVALMLLALFTLFQYLPLHKKAKTASPQQEQQVAQTEAQQLAALPLVSTQAESKTATPTITTAQESHPKVLIKKAKIDDSPATLTNTNAPDLIEIPSNQPSTPTTTSPAEATAWQAVEDNGIQLFSNQSNLQPLALGHLELQQIGFGQYKNTSWARIQQLINGSNASIASNSLDVANLSLASLPMGPIPIKRQLSSTCAFCQFKKPVQVRVGMFISSDFNEIMTPEKAYPNFVDAAYQQVTAGYGGGISLGFRHKKWEFETGLAYAHLSYEPNQTLIVTGSFLRSSIQRQVFDAAFLNIIKIPLHLNYTFNRNGKWHFYAIGGASINVLALNHFNHSTSSVGNISSAGERDPSPPPPSFVKGPTYNGVFEGGDFRVNSYYTANVGMGVERSLTSRWSIFMQPVYQHMFYRKGFGPNNDRFNTLSIQFGAKSTFR